MSSVFNGLGEGGILHFNLPQLYTRNREETADGQRCLDNYTWGGKEVLAGQGQGSMYVMMAPQYEINYDDFFSDDDDPERKTSKVCIR